MTSLDDAIAQSQARGPLARLAGTQVFWVLLAALLACLALTLLTDSFATSRNLFNVLRNFAFVAIIALGSFGAAEMGYSSDADVQFLAIDRGAGSATVDIAIAVATQIQRILNAPAAGPDSTVVIGWCTTSSAESTPPLDFMT